MVKNFYQFFEEYLLNPDDGLTQIESLREYLGEVTGEARPSITTSEDVKATCHIILISLIKVSHQIQ